MRDANIDLPDPGGPIIRRLWLPAAAISRARLAVSWPLMSFRSGSALCAGRIFGFGRDSVCISLPAYRDVAHAGYYAAVTELFDRVDGRPHWGSAHDKTDAALRPLYPHFDDFCRLRAELDPHDLFMNPHLGRLFGVTLR